jgi:hypothetical protein
VGPNIKPTHHKEGRIEKYVVLLARDNNLIVDNIFQGGMAKFLRSLQPYTEGTQVVIDIDSAFIVEAVWAKYIRLGKDTPRQISAAYGRFPQFGDLLQFTADGGIAVNTVTASREPYELLILGCSCNPSPIQAWYAKSSNATGREIPYHYFCPYRCRCGRPDTPCYRQHLPPKWDEI